MIGFLRFIGVMNAALWLGGAVFFTVGAWPALLSPEMQALLGSRNFPYFSETISQIVFTRYYHFSLACAVVAWLQLLAEWLYLGRPARKFPFTLLTCLLVVTLLSGNLLLPQMKRLHTISYAVNVSPAGRAAAAKSFRAWRAASQAFNLFLIAGLFVYVWRVTNPPDPSRFITSVKFRG